MRGTVQLVWNAATSSVVWEFMDRISQQVIDSYSLPMTADTGGGGTFQRILLPQQSEQRIYVWTSSNKSGETFVPVHRMYWMQSRDEEGEDDIVAKINQYLENPTEAAPPRTEEPQVDALSNILENLGIPQTEPQTQPLGGGGILTLADLQGAMAGLGPMTTPGTSPTPRTQVLPLTEIVTHAAMDSLLQDDAAKNRLLEFLPPDQRDMSHLEDNLKSPQVQQTLQSLSQALLPDETGNLDGYHSVIANFQLDPKDGEEALRSGNPIQAFLDCVLASVKQKNSDSDNENDNGEEEMKDDEEHRQE